MTERFRVTLGNNTVRFVDFEENKQLMSISFKKHNDAIDCQNALKFQCDLLNELNNQADAVRTELQLCEEENTELQKENEQLKSEINMLKTTISRNEAYIQQIKHKGEWK